ncbi:hypothetical protein Csa_017154, partial [Cucumis sativus]
RSITFYDWRKEPGLDFQLEADPLHLTEGQKLIALGLELETSCFVMLFTTYTTS